MWGDEGTWKDEWLEEFQEFREMKFFFQKGE